MSKNKKAVKPQTSSTELLETRDEFTQRLADTEKFVKQNRLLLGIAVTVVVLLVGGYFLYNYVVSSQEQEAQAEMFPALYYLQNDNLDAALKGDGNYPGFKDIVEDYPWSKGANLARFYLGTIYLKQGKYSEAIAELNKFSATDLIMQGRAYCLIGDAYMEQSKWNEAINYYQKAATYKANKHFTPGYLMKLGLAYEKANKNTEAIAAYDKVMTLYFNSVEAANAKKYKAKLEAQNIK
ncbi:MAG: tetratricopeptide repeat protein [Microscillaceae bacterium]|jgi:tetratricopeptide (TPR) repeat protein|nr:tetratricopeptide repeat protein [Microscillaceae bacterium]